MANKTVQDIYTATDSLLRQEGNSSGVPGMEETQTIVWINDLHQQFFDEFTTAGMNYPPYMKKRKGYTGVSGTYLTADVTSGASSFTVNSSDALDTSGAGVIYKNSQYDIFTHSGNSSGTVSGVSGVDFDHDENEAVTKLYALPSDFGRFRIEHDRMTRGEGVRVNATGYTEVPDMPAGTQFSRYQASDASWYLWMPQNETGDILVTYDKKPTSLTLTTSTIDIPSSLPDHWYLIYGLAAIFKQVLDETYVPTKERQQQEMVLKAAMKRASAGKRIQVSNVYFRRFGS